jgi:hypothetical protein
MGSYVLKNWCYYQLFLQPIGSVKSSSDRIFFCVYFRQNCGGLEQKKGSNGISLPLLPFLLTILLVND